MDIIGLDLDSVLTHTEEVIHKYVLDHFGICMDWDKVERYELEYFPGLTPEMGVQLKTEIESGVVLMDVRPHEYASQSIKMLKEAGFDVYIITARPKHLEEPTKEWLKAYGLFYDKMFLARSRDKHEFVKEFDIKAFVEDRYDVLESIKDKFGVLGLGMYLVTHPWNRRFNCDYVIRVNDIKEAVNEIIKRRNGYDR